MLHAEGIPLWQERVLSREDAEQSGLFERNKPTGHRPTVVIGLSHEDALWATSRAKEFGLKVPDDLSVATFGDYHSGRTGRSWWWVKSSPDFAWRREAGTTIMDSCPRILGRGWFVFA